MGKESDEARYEEALKKLESALDIYEELLSKQKYLAGDVRVDLHSTSHLLTFLVFRRSPWSICSTFPSGMLLNQLRRTLWRRDRMSPSTSTPLLEMIHD